MEDNYEINISESPVLNIQLLSFLLFTHLFSQYIHSCHLIRFIIFVFLLLILDLDLAAAHP